MENSTKTVGQIQTADWVSFIPPVTRRVHQRRGISQRGDAKPPCRFHLGEPGLLSHVPDQPHRRQPQPGLDLGQRPAHQNASSEEVGIGSCPWPLITVAPAGEAPGMWWSTTTVGTPGFGSVSRTPKSVMTTPPSGSSANSVRIASDHGVSPRPTMRVRTPHPAAPKARANNAAADKPFASLWPRRV
jgi:hypothetical protein